MQSKSFSSCVRIGLIFSFSASSPLRLNWGSSACIENALLDAAPSGANPKRRGASVEASGIENAGHARREICIRQHLLEIVDEMRAVEGGDAAQLVAARSFEEHVFGRDAVLVRPKKTMLRHPRQRCRAQVHARRIVMAELGLVADDEHARALAPATSQEPVDALAQGRLGDARA